MIKTVGKYLGFTLLFLIFTLLFLPKVALWYQAESVIQKYQIIIDGEELHDAYTHLEISQATLMAQGLEVAKISQIHIWTWLIYNKLSLQNVFSGKNAKMLQGLSVKEATVSHHIFSPLTLSINASGNFGTLEGIVSLSENSVDLLIHPTQALKRNRLIVRELKSTKEGYRFVRHF